jgi:hypothetical protein
VKGANEGVVKPGVAGPGSAAKLGNKEFGTSHGTFIVDGGMGPSVNLLNGELPNPGSADKFGMCKPPTGVPVPVVPVPVPVVPVPVVPPEELEPLSLPSGPGVANATAPAPAVNMQPTTTQTMAA